MLQNLQSLYVFKSMSKSSLNFIYKRAYTEVNILIRCDKVLWIYSIKHKVIPLNFIFYNIQINPDINFVYIRLYYCLKYYKTVHNLSVFMNYVLNEVFICFNQSSLKVAFINQSITNRDPHIYH